MYATTWISSVRLNTVYKLYLQSIVVGVSAGISFHFLTNKRPTAENEADKTSHDVGIRTSIFRVVSSALENIRNQICSCNIPLWICMAISLPVYLSLSSRNVHREKILLWTALGSQLLMISRNQKDRDDGGSRNDGNQPSLREKASEPLRNSDEEDSLREDSDEAAFPKAKVLKAFIEKTSFSSKEEEKYTRRSKFPKNQRFLEVLVHNVSHSDLVLGLDVTNTAHDVTDKQKEGDATIYDWENICLARPRFSSFDRYSRLILDQISLVDASTIFLPRYQRTLDNPRYTIQEFPMTELPPSPAGIQLCSNRVCTYDRKSLQHELKVRSRDSGKLDQYFNQQKSPINNATCEIVQDNSTDDNNTTQDGLTIKVSHAIFPFLATLLPVWEQSINAKKYSHDSSIKRVLILVTGVGTPRNMEHSLAGNSTKYLGQILQNFIQRIDPSLTVVQIHSNTNVFRYDENLVFAERELIPIIHAYRDALATGSAYPDELPKNSSNKKLSNEPARMNLENNRHKNFSDNNWRQFMSLTLSFACGSPARTTAIQVSLRHFKPAYFHFWQLKTFWHEQKIVDDDIEIHSFEAMMETSPAQDVEQIQDVHIQSVVKEMKAFQLEMNRILSGSSEQHDLYRFWLRKTHKLVLAVLLVQSNTMKEPQLFRGTNMEVSMPTGSLCAERNVIGSALSQFPSLKRQDLKVIAVLAVPPMDCGSSAEEVCYEIPRNISYASALDAALAVDGLRSRQFSLGSENEALFRGRGNSGSIGSEQEGWSVTPFHQDIIPPPIVSNMHNAMHSNGASTPVRRIPLFSGNVANNRNPKRTVLVRSDKDMNPLRPCGACNEWLKKIAESNPYFQIVTFTDANCKGIYVSSCQD